MSHIYPHILPKIEDWPIYKFAKHRKEFVKELNEFVFKREKDGTTPWEELQVEPVKN